MKKQHLYAALFLCLPLPLLGQEAHSQAIGGATSAAPMGVFSPIWNPAFLVIPDDNNMAWSVGSGFTAYDTSNTNNAILHFVPDDARGGSEDPVLRSQDYEGIFSVRYQAMAGAVHYEKTLAYSGSQGTLQFFHDRDQASLSATPYSLGLSQTSREIATLVLAYGSMLPLGSSQAFSIGGNLKYHDGLTYEQINMSGTYTHGSLTGYTFTKTTSSAGSGLSVDMGLFTRLSDSFQMGFVIENIESNFNWQAQQQTYQLDQTTGAESKVGNPTNIQVSDPFPYTTKLGVDLTPPEKNTGIEAEVAWSQGQTRWHVGLEHYYPETNLVVRLGTFADQVSNQQMWCFGVGYIQKNFNVDVSFVTRSIPDLQNSVGLGGGIDAAVRF
ncbi:MAG TPA: hypothetical protein VHE12_06100 [bacterium]|nr:hypothetical protein [bacterium]